MMHTGDVWELAVPGKLGFGEKGRSASPGKPRIPNNAVRLPPSLPPWGRREYAWVALVGGGAGGRAAAMCAANRRGACTCGPAPNPMPHTPEEMRRPLAPPSCAALLRRPLEPPSCAAQDLIFVVELSAVPGKDEEIIDILEAEAEEAAAAKAALGAKVAPKQPED